MEVLGVCLSVDVLPFNDLVLFLVLVSFVCLRAARVIRADSGPVSLGGLSGRSGFWWGRCFHELGVASVFAFFLVVFGQLGGGGTFTG